MLSTGSLREARKYVVVLFIDLVGSTSLAEMVDAEPLRKILDRYYEICRGAIAEHGGVVEKFIGDAVMAVFGVPTTNEDDGLRALRAASAVRAGVTRLRASLSADQEVILQVHCGVASGEAVVVSTPHADVRVVGDVVNTASRVQSTADAGEILISESVARAVREKVRIEALPPVQLKGKANPVRLWRLLSLNAVPSGQLDLVGRATELNALTEGFAEACRSRGPWTINVLGAAGIGKSRLVQEFVARLGDAVTVLSASCPSYGTGLTYVPLAQLLESHPGGWDAVAAILQAEPGGPRALRCLTAATRRHDIPPRSTGREPSTQEISWAIRILVRAIARTQPLVLIVDDLHWAQSTLVRLLNDIALANIEACVLLIYVARSDQIESGTAWAADGHRTTTVELDPLSAAEMGALIAGVTANHEVIAHDAAWPDERLATDRVVARCGGNPLFARLMVEIMSADGDHARVPSTIRSMLEARIDRLPDSERAVLERAAAVGGTFTRAQLSALLTTELPSDADLDNLLRRLTERQMIQPGGSSDEFQFENTLVRETAYAVTSKDQRARWHLLLADCETGDASGTQLSEEEVANHLASACELLREARPGEPSLTGLADRASRALIEVGARAQWRNDLPAAVALLERGTALLPPGHRDHGSLGVRMSDAWLSLGEMDAARTALDRAERAVGEDVSGRQVCQVQRQILAVRADGRLDAPTDRADDLLRASEDDLVRCRIRQLDALRNVARGRIGAAESALREALSYARAAGSAYEEERMLGAVCEIAQWSPTPVRECMPFCEELIERFGEDRALLVPVLLTMARLQAYSGALDAARARMDMARRYVADLGLTVASAAVSQIDALLESLEGAHDKAARHYAGAARRLRELGQPTTAATFDACSARELLRAGHLHAAEELVATLDPNRMDQRGRLVHMAAEARLAAMTGGRDRVASIASIVIDELAETDDPCLRGEVHLELARAYATAGGTDSAAGHVSAAVTGYLVKEADLPARLARAWHDGLTTP